MSSTNQSDDTEEENESESVSSADTNDSNSKNAGARPDPPDSPSTEKPFESTKPSGNPLDALAFACVAEEKMRNSASPPASDKSPSHPPASQLQAKRGKSHSVPAEEISCTDVLCGRGGQSNHHVSLYCLLLPCFWLGLVCQLTYALRPVVYL